jgi:hypothetical protein
MRIGVLGAQGALLWPDPAERGPVSVSSAAAIASQQGTRRGPLRRRGAAAAASPVPHRRGCAVRPLDGHERRKPELVTGGSLPP